MHHPSYNNNFMDRTVTAKCTCGWSDILADQVAAVSAWREHMLEVEKPKTVTPLRPVLGEHDQAAVDYFRALADRIEKGEVENVVVAFMDKNNYQYERFGHWKDRWTMYGAIEYAKAAIDHAD